MSDSGRLEGIRLAATCSSKALDGTRRLAKYADILLNGTDADPVSIALFTLTLPGIEQCLWMWHVAPPSIKKRLAIASEPAVAVEIGRGSTAARIIARGACGAAVRAAYRTVDLVRRSLGAPALRQAIDEADRLEAIAFFRRLAAQPGTATEGLFRKIQRYGKAAIHKHRFLAGSVGPADTEGRVYRYLELCILADRSREKLQLFLREEGNEARNILQTAADVLEAGLPDSPQDPAVAMVLYFGFRLARSKAFWAEVHSRQKGTLQPFQSKVGGVVIAPQRMRQACRAAVRGSLAGREHKKLQYMIDGARDDALVQYRQQTAIAHDRELDGEGNEPSRPDLWPAMTVYRLFMTHFRNYAAFSRYVKSHSIENEPRGKRGLDVNALDVMKALRADLDAEERAMQDTARRKAR